MNLLTFLTSSNWNFTLENYDTVWKILVNIGLVLIALLIGNVLRNIIPLFKKFLIPSALIGGGLLLLVDILFKKIFNYDLIDESIMQIVTYHCLGIGFIAMTLKIQNKGKTPKKEAIKVVENGALTGGCYMIQAFFGLLITIVLYLITKNTDKEVCYVSGVILPLGFGQGPGNALAWDINFSDYDWLNFDSNGSFGLTIASIGFIVASIFGVLYINIFKKKGEIVEKTQKNTDRKIEDFEGDNEIPDNESVDKFSIQLGLVALSYALSFGIMCALGAISDFTNSIAWGFNFIWGVITANLIKIVIKKLRKKDIIKRDYINNYQMDRISGFAFDLMIVTGVAAIDIEKVSGYIFPIILLCVVGTIVTFLYCRIITKHCFKGYEHEMFVTNFGTVTGTASNGMILLKEIDPNFETKASGFFVLSQLPAMIFVAPLLLLLSFTAKSFTNTIIGCSIFLVLFIGYTIFLFRDKIFKNKKE